MKKLCAMFLTAALLLPVCGLPVYADQPEISVPYDSWELVASADFIGDGETTVDNYSSQGITSWSSSGSTEGRTPLLTADGLSCTSSNSQLSCAVGMLANPISLTEDDDYYLVYSSNFPTNGWQSSISSELKRESTYYNAANSRDELRNDSVINNVSTSNSPASYSSGYSYQCKNPETMGNYAWGGKSINTSQSTGYVPQAGKKQTVLSRISVRGNKLLVNSRIFAEDETPTFDPDYWDIHVSNTLSWPEGDTNNKNLDRIYFGYTQNSGSNNSCYIYGFKLYKTPALSAYSIDNNNDYPSLIAARSTISVPSDASLTEKIEWFDATDGEKLIYTGNEYTIPDSMIGKTLKIILTTTTGETYPVYTGLVHDMYEVNYITAAISGDSGFNKDDFTTYDKAKTLTITTEIMRNAIPTKEGTAALITAQYDKDGMLKNVVTTKLNNRFPSMGAGFGWNVKMSYTFNFDQENINYAAGDYFKCYIWESSVNTVNGYVHDIIRPMTFNLEKLTPISNIAFTIPDAQ